MINNLGLIILQAENSILVNLVDINKNPKDRAVLGFMSLHVYKEDEYAQTFQNAAEPGYAPLLFICSLQLVKLFELRCLIPDPRRTSKAVKLWESMIKFESIDRCYPNGLTLLESYNKFDRLLFNGINWLENKEKFLYDLILDGISYFRSSYKEEIDETYEDSIEYFKSSMPYDSEKIKDVEVLTFDK